MGFGRNRLDWFGALLAHKQWEPYGCYGHNGLWLGEVAQRRSKSENRRLIQFESTRDPLEILPCILSVVANIATQSFTKSLRQCFNQSKTDVSQQDFLQPVHFLWFLSTKKKNSVIRNNLRVIMFIMQSWLEFDQNGNWWIKHTIHVYSWISCCSQRREKKRQHCFECSRFRETNNALECLQVKKNWLTCKRSQIWACTAH